MQHLEQKDAEHIIKTLCDNMVGDNENLRDISRTGLKTIIAGLPSSSLHLTKVIGENVIERLTEVAKKRSDLLVQLKVLTSRPLTTTFRLIYSAKSKIKYRRILSESRSLCSYCCWRACA